MVIYFDIIDIILRDVTLFFYLFISQVLWPFDFVLISTEVYKVFKYQLYLKSIYLSTK